MTEHSGRCHCGAVSYRAQVALDEVMACNCSICQKQGTLLAFTPETDFTLLSGEDNLTDYQFNRKQIHHLFCKSCGVKPFGKGADADGRKIVAINIRTIDNIDLSALTITPFDGKSL